MSQNKFLKVLAKLDNKSRKVLVSCMATNLYALDPKVRNYITYCLKHDRSKPELLEKKSIVKEFKLTENAYNNYVRKSNNYLKSFIPNIHKNANDFQDYALLDFYSLNDLDKHFETHYKSYLKKPSDFRLRRMYEDYQIEKLAIEFSFHSKSVLKRHPITNSIELLDLNYWTEKTYSECFRINRQLVLNVPFKPSNFLNETTLVALENIAKKSPLLNFNLAYYNCLTTGTGFTKAKNALLKLDRNKIGARQHLPCVQFILNYCVRQFNQDRLKYLDEFLKIVDFHSHSDGLLDRRGILYPWMFKASFMAGLKAKKIKWTEKFIEKYKNNLPSREKALLYELAMASVDLHRRKPKSIIQTVIKNYTAYDSNDPFEKLLLNKLLIQAYFLDENFIKATEEARLFLRRNKRSHLPERVIKPLNHFLKYIIQLAKVLNNPDSKSSDKHKVLKDIKGNREPVKDRAWLIEMVEA